MKRYMVFAGDRYYASGGATNLIGQADTLDEAWEMVGPSAYADNDGKYEWCHAYDTQTDKIIARPGWTDEDDDDSSYRGYGGSFREPEGVDEWSDY